MTLLSCHKQAWHKQAMPSSGCSGSIVAEPLTLLRNTLVPAAFRKVTWENAHRIYKEEAEVVGKPPTAANPQNDIKKGFVYERVPHITLKSIANNEEIDVIHVRYESQFTPLREKLTQALKKKWEEWEVPRLGRIQAFSVGFLGILWLTVLQVDGPGLS
jgi:hypothetical protein